MESGKVFFVAHLEDYLLLFLKHLTKEIEGKKLQQRNMFDLLYDGFPCWKSLISMAILVYWRV